MGPGFESLWGHQNDESSVHRSNESNARRSGPVPGHRLGGRSNYSVWSTMDASAAFVRTDSMPFFAAAFVV